MRSTEVIVMIFPTASVIVTGSTGSNSGTMSFSTSGVASGIDGFSDSTT